MFIVALACEGNEGGATKSAAGVQPRVAKQKRNHIPSKVLPFAIRYFQTPLETRICEPFSKRLGIPVSPGRHFEKMTDTVQALSHHFLRPYGCHATWCSMFEPCRDVGNYYEAQNVGAAIAIAGVNGRRHEYARGL